MTSSLAALAAFALAASVTPGPNNAMVAATAASRGFRAALPQVFGICLGFAAMLAIVALGVAGALTAAPQVARLLRLVSLAWLLLLAWRIARAGAPGSAAAGTPLGFLGAVAFQWVNPKAWFVALGASAAWVAPGQPLGAQAAAIGGVFLAVGLPCVLAWAALGSVAARLLQTPARLRAFNIAMATLMVSSMLPVALGI